ncbi:hypothetical protein Tco_0557009, partial [Tanacetum coccineum]
ASGTIPPKTKGSKKKANTDAIPKLKLPTAPKEKKSGKGKQKTAELETISEADLTEAEQLKIITKRSRQETHSSHASGSGADEGTGVIPGVPDAPDYDSEDDISWKSSDDDQDDEQAQDDDDADKNDVNETTQDDEDDDVHDDDENAQEDDDEHDDDKKAQDDDDEELTESDDDGDDFVHPKLTTHDDEIIHEEDTDEDDSSISSSDEEDSDNEVEGTNVEGAKTQEEATYTEDQGNEEVKDTNTDLERVNSNDRFQLKYGENSRRVLYCNQNSLIQLMTDKENHQGTMSKKEVSKIIPKVEKFCKTDRLESEVCAIIKDTYGDTVTIKRPRDGADDDEEPSARTDQGSKKEEGKTTSTGTKTHTKSASQSAPVGDAMHSTDVFKGPADQEFETGGITSGHDVIGLTKPTTEKLDWIHTEVVNIRHVLRQHYRLFRSNILQGRRVIPFITSSISTWNIYVLRGGTMMMFSASSKKANFHRLRIKDIEDLLLLLVQEKSMISQIGGIFCPRDIPLDSVEVLGMIKKEKKLWNSNENMPTEMRANTEQTQQSWAIFVPLLPAMLTGAAVDQGKGSAQPAEPHHAPIDPISSTSQPPIPSPIQSHHLHYT